MRRGYDFLRAGQPGEAQNCCKLVLKYRPKATEAHFLLGLAASEYAGWTTALQAFRNVTGIDAGHAAAWAQLARIYVMIGQYSNCSAALEQAVALKPTDPFVQEVIGNAHSLLGDQQSALVWFEKACASSDNPNFELSRAKAMTFLGDIAGAQVSLAKVIENRPLSGQAHWMLARAAKASGDAHVDQMAKAVANKNCLENEKPFFHYGRGKLLEDLERWNDAFAAYQEGARCRRAEVSFDESGEDALYKTLASVFTKDWFNAVSEGNSAKSPIFIIGEPRTGTTLVERIITAHSDVSSAGELQQFGMAVRRKVGAVSRALLSEENVQAASHLDMAELGDAYMDTTKTVQGSASYFIDKLPLNYLHAPLIAAALPNAKIIHVVRDPMDSCMASYKQLFADAYFHSYDLEEMARHHARYMRLMEHWRQVLGPRMLEVHYEAVVENVEANARNIIDFLGLEWQNAILSFHEQQGAVTTASAVQVREHAHSRSVGRWKKYEQHLMPIKQILRIEGFL